MATTAMRMIISIIFISTYVTHITLCQNITEEFYQSTCSAVSRGYLSALRTGWYTSVVTIELSKIQKNVCNSTDSKVKLIKQELERYNNAVVELQSLMQNEPASSSRAKEGYQS